MCVFLLHVQPVLCMAMSALAESLKSLFYSGNTDFFFVEDICVVYIEA